MAPQQGHTPYRKKHLRLKNGKRGISEAVAALILILIVLAAASVAYAYFTGGLNRGTVGVVNQQVTGGERAGQIIKVVYPPQTKGDTTYFLIEDVGDIPVQIGYCMQGNTAVSCTLETPPPNSQPVASQVMQIDEIYQLAVNTKTSSGVLIYASNTGALLPLTYPLQLSSDPNPTNTGHPLELTLKTSSFGIIFSAYYNGKLLGTISQLIPTLPVDFTATMNGEMLANATATIQYGNNIYPNLTYQPLQGNSFSVWFTTDFGNAEIAIIANHQSSEVNTWNYNGNPGATWVVYFQSFNLTGSVCLSYGTYPLGCV